MRVGARFWPCKDRLRKKLAQAVYGFVLASSFFTASGVGNGATAPKPVVERAAAALA